MATPSLRSLHAERQHAAVILARQAAQKAVKRQIQREGRIKLSSLTAARIARLAYEWLDHHPELIAEALASELRNCEKAKGRWSQRQILSQLMCKMESRNGRRLRPRKH